MIGNDAKQCEQLITADEIGFKPEEMRACGSCNRANPPTRLSCLYCSKELELRAGDERHLKITSRRLENWEKGHNVTIISAPGAASSSELADIVRRFAINIELLEAIVPTSVPIPVARVETRTEADLVADGFRAAGFSVQIVIDGELMPEQPPVRCRAITFDSGFLVITPFNEGPNIRLGASDVVLFVSGVFYESKATIKKERKRGKNNVSTESQTSFNMPLIDLYSKHDARGFRIMASGFDFSVLGEEKSLIASKNLERLTDQLRGFAADAKFVDAYKNIRTSLDLVWEPELRKDSRGVKRSLLVRRGVEAVFTTSNIQQFTKYSRLVRLLV